MSMVRADIFTIPFPATEHLFAGVAERLRAAGRGRGLKLRAEAGSRLGFIAGPENRLVWAAAQQVLSAVGPTASAARFSPLVLCGPAGCGKSHLVRGLTEQWRRMQQDGQGVLCVSAAEWTSRTLSLLTKNPADRRAVWLDSIRLLVIDDIHQLPTTGSAMAGLRQIVDELLARDTQIIFTSRVAPEQLADWPDDLRARLSGGLVAPVALPGEQARGAIVAELARLCEIRLSPEAIERLAAPTPSSAPQLLTALAELAAQTGELRRTIGADEVDAFLSCQAAESRVPLERIAKAVARQNRLKLSDLKGRSRRRNIATARSVYMYLARALSGESLAAIGRHCGGRDHTTVLHSCRKIDALLGDDLELRQQVVALQTELQGRGT